MINCFSVRHYLPKTEVAQYRQDHDIAISTISMPKMTKSQAILIKLVERYLVGLLDPSVSLLEVHKLIYFMLEAGEPLRLKYQKAHYGPYAENLRHVLNAIEGYFISGYADGGDAPDKTLQLVPGAFEEANAFLERHPQTRERFNRVSQLVTGFESPFGIELLATVHWLCRYEQVATAEECDQGDLCVESA